MFQVFPILLFGGLLLTRSKAKKVSSYELIETGNMALLPKDGQNLITVDLHPHQMIEILAVSTPSVTWISKLDGQSVLINQKNRAQDPVTQSTIFEIKAKSLGDSKITFEKLANDGKLLDRRHLRIAVME